MRQKKVTSERFLLMHSDVESKIGAPRCPANWFSRYPFNTTRDTEETSTPQTDWRQLYIGCNTPCDCAVVNYTQLPIYWVHLAKNQRGVQYFSKTVEHYNPQGFIAGLLYVSLKSSEKMWLKRAAKRSQVRRAEFPHMSSALVETWWLEKKKKKRRLICEATPLCMFR